MAKIAYLDCPTGIAGDMCLGALVHAGVPLDYLIEQLELLGIADEFKLWAESVHRNGQQATKVHVDLANGVQEEWGDAPERASAQQAVLLELPHPEHSHDHSHDHSHAPIHSHEQHPVQGSRHLPEIEKLIQSAGLPTRAETWSLAVFRQLAAAEGAVHGISPDQVHFHEVGATDAIVDIVGTCLGLDWLGIDGLYCSALPTGGGTLWAAHGRLPVPTPAVLKLWEMRQVPIYSNGIDRELVTPTGAAIATTLALDFGAPPAMTLQKIGLGAGSRDFAISNILRLWIGEAPEPLAESKKSGGVSSKRLNQAAVFATDATQETISVLETQIDDLNPQAIGYVFEALIAAGALDVFTQAIGMKKSRPGILLTVICRPEQAIACETLMFRETTTLGIRHTSQQRTALAREMHQVQTHYGTVRIKVARWQDGKIANVQPEYEDCAQLARSHCQPWQVVHRSALQAWELAAAT